MLEAKYIGFKELNKKLKKVRRNLSNFRIVNKSIVIYLDSEVQKQFRTEGYFLTGEKWEGLKEATKKRRRGKGGFKILQDKGTLRDNWDHISTQRKAGIRSKVFYGTYHHEGRGHLPERKIIPDTSSRKFKKDILKLYSIWLKKGRRSFK